VVFPFCFFFFFFLFTFALTGAKKAAFFIAIMM